MNQARHVLLGSVAVFAWLWLSPAQIHAVPSFARQTGLSCEDCHTQFPELTQMGRNFKLSGYSVGVKWVKKDGATDTAETKGAGDTDALGAPVLPPISAMLQASYTVVRSQPDPVSTDAGAGADKRGTAEIPQQASLFLAGQLAPNLGAFVQMTYDSSFHFDNTDLRYARSQKLGSQPLILGLDVNNNPTVQDVWNSSPAWGFPYAVPGTSAFSPNSPQIASLGGSVLGAGAYAYYANLLYLEASGYRSNTLGAPEGGAAPAILGTAPYWRAALVHEQDDMSYMLGAFGMGMDQMASSALPQAPSSHYDDVAGDFQIQYTGDPHIVTLTGSFIHERSRTPAVPSAAQANLSVAKLTGEYLYGRAAGATLNFTDTRDDDGVSGLLDTRTLTYQVDYLFSLNTKFSLQYVQYLSAAGVAQGSPYALDPNGVSSRQPEDNNTLLAQAWLLF